MLSRRGFIFGIGATFAVVRPEILMPIKSFIIPCTPEANLLPPGTYEMQIENVFFEYCKNDVKMYTHLKNYASSIQNWNDNHIIVPITSLELSNV